MFVLKWHRHWVSGWAPNQGEYQASMVDNYGNADVYRGRIEGDRLVFESMPGSATHLRFTWDASDPGVIKWRNEMAAGAAHGSCRGIPHGAGTAADRNGIGRPKREAGRAGLHSHLVVEFLAVSHVKGTQTSDLRVD